jgi:hypothetical protein
VNSGDKGYRVRVHECAVLAGQGRQLIVLQECRRGALVQLVAGGPSGRQAERGRLGRSACGSTPICVPLHTHTFPPHIVADALWLLFWRFGRTALLCTVHRASTLPSRLISAARHRFCAGTRR